MAAEKPSKHILKKAKALKLQPVQLPFQAICMDGQPYQYWDQLPEKRFPTAKEEEGMRLHQLGTYRTYEGILEYTDTDGKFYIARDVKPNCDALEAAGFKRSSDFNFFASGNAPSGENKAAFKKIMETPQDAQEQLEWAMRNNDLVEFNRGLENGAKIKTALSYDGPIIFDAIKKENTADRDEIIRKLLPESEHKSRQDNNQTLLHAAIQSPYPTYTVIPDFLAAGVDPLQLDNNGIPSFLGILMNKQNDFGNAPSADQKERKLLVDAILKKEGIGKKERQQIQAQSRIINALFEEYRLDASVPADAIKALRAVWEFAHALVPADNKGKVPELVVSLLEPLADAAGAPNPLRAKGASSLLETLTHADVEGLNGQLNDMIREFTAHVVLPQALLEYSKQHNQPLTDEFLAPLQADKIVSALVYYVKMKLCEERSIDKIIGLNLAWHDPQVAFPDTLRPLRASGEWHALTQEREYAVPDLQGITIHVLTTSDDLVHEGKIMNHCVGGGDYATKCLSGEAHIFSVRKTGETKPLSTIEATWDGKTFAIRQNYGEGNGAAPHEAVQAATWLKKQLETGALRANKAAGETEESKKRNVRPAILRTIGFEITQENVNAAFAEYTRNAKRRAREYNPDTKKFDIISRRTELIAGNYNKEVIGEDGKPKRIGVSLKELPADEWFAAVGLTDVVDIALRSGGYPFSYTLARPEDMAPVRFNRNDGPQLVAPEVVPEEFQLDDFDDPVAAPPVQRRGLFGRIRDAWRGGNNGERAGRG